RYAQSDQHLEAAIEAASQRRGARTTLHIAATLAVNALEQGDLPRARRWAADALVEDDREGVDQNQRANTLVAAAVVHASAGDLGTALALAERAVALCNRDLVRHDVLARWRLAVLQADLGRRDLALRSLRRLASRGDLHGPDLPRVQAALLGLGDALPQAEVLERIVALEDVPLRATLLCVAQPGCAPTDVLPLLAMAASGARDQGAHGLWLALQGRRAAALVAAGRHGDAVDVARAAWSAMVGGVVGVEGTGRVGMTLSAVLRDADPELARTVALRTSAWVYQAASTLPPLWRDSYLRRSVATALPSA
ncbi:MAG: hypothetical protein KDG57_23935, partial [Rhodoferax sp.]|nr:hypothetical protein [Rhodoferax sp.]